MHPFKKDFWNPNVTGGLRWLHIHLGLVLAILGSLVLLGAQSHQNVTAMALPTRPASFLRVTAPIHFRPNGHPRFVRHTTYCEIHASSCPAAVNPSQSDIVRMSNQSNWYVGPVYTADTGVRIDPIINAAGDYYNIWPTYIYAVILAESGGNQYAWHNWGWPDISGGLTQETVETLAGYGVCNNDISCAQAWEYNVTNSIWMGARILRDYMNETGVGYPGLWQCYNAGPGSCQSPYYDAFLGAYSRALPYGTSRGVIASTVSATATPVPTPTPNPKTLFNVSRWRRDTRRLGLPAVPFLWNGRLGNVSFEWQFNRMAFGKVGSIDHACGGVIGTERWDADNHVMWQRFRHCGVWSWPQVRGDPTKWVKLPTFTKRVTHK